jgi:hypothetical protein
MQFSHKIQKRKAVSQKVGNTCAFQIAVGPVLGIFLVFLTKKSEKSGSKMVRTSARIQKVPVRLIDETSRESRKKEIAKEKRTRSKTEKEKKPEVKSAKVGRMKLGERGLFFSFLPLEKSQSRPGSQEGACPREEACVQEEGCLQEGCAQEEEGGS